MKNENQNVEVNKKIWEAPKMTKLGIDETKTGVFSVTEIPFASGPNS